MSNIRNRKREYEAGLDWRSVYRKAQGHLLPDPSLYPEDLALRAKQVFQEFLDSEEKEEDPIGFKIKRRSW